MKIQELLSSEDKWTKGTVARNKDEEIVPSYSSEAVKWCLIGAILKCYPSQESKIMWGITKATNKSVGEFNDSHSYEEVIELVRRLDI